MRTGGQLKRQLGCHGLPDPELDGNVRPWTFPPAAPGQPTRVQAEQCPLKLIRPDVWALVRSYYCADGVLSCDEQATRPPPWVAAWSMFKSEKNSAEIHRWEEERKAQG